jgi:hypothetical protein
MNKILLVDIETSPTLGYSWTLWEADIIKVIEPWYMLSFAYKWLGDKKINVVSLPQFPTYNTDKKNDCALVKRLWEIFNEAEIIIAHNGDKFDIRKTMAKFIEHGLTPPAPYKTVDTLKVARKYFKFDSNRLDYLGEYLGIGRKIKTGGFDLWDGCMNGDKKAWKLMEKYNMVDVDLLEKVYYRLRPYIKNHPNLNLLQETLYNCPICGSKNTQKRGFSYSRTHKYQRFQCLDCFGWSQSPLNGVLR